MGVWLGMGVMEAVSEAVGVKVGSRVRVGVGVGVMVGVRVIVGEMVGVWVMVGVKVGGGASTDGYAASKTARVRMKINIITRLVSRKRLRAEVETGSGMGDRVQLSGDGSYGFLCEI